ncbi:uncharacterized protein LOC5573843 [Aedes aegypti]|uniref:NACHT domain-containing protein n=1 Tax=Aedes aegypti TaxID=7159 RepID=A0A6I8U2X6_AEDAE|nr:uncharacterized protein LOC5573843 [Aedes aegypti]XP_021707795.1 uncharacterized protein LOC5573843 [Aedes aegypti]
MDGDGVYKKDGNLGGARHGDAYQVHLLMLMGERAISNERYVDFRLATEMEAAGKFDDAVLMWKGVDDSRNWLFVQVKYKLGCCPQIGEKDLFPDTEDLMAKGDFSLYKYLVSFWESMRRSDMEGEKQFVIFTNSSLAESVEDSFEDGEHDVEPVLRSGVNGARFLKIRSKEEQCEQLINYANKAFIDLTEAMRSAVINKDKDTSLELVNKYRGALNNKVLIVSDGRVKFAPRFIRRNKLDLVERIMRNKLFHGDETLEQLMSYGVSNDQLLKILTSKSKSCNTLPPMITLSEAQDFLDSIIFAVKQPNNAVMKATILNELRSHPTSPTNRCGSGDDYVLLTYSTLQHKIHSLLDSPSGRALCRKDLEMEFHSVQRSISSSRLSMQTNLFRCEMLNLRMELAKPELRIPEYPAALVSSTRGGLLTCLKLFHILPENTLRFFSLKDLRHHSIMRELCEALREPNADFHLLLKDDCPTFEYASDIFNVIPSNGMIKLVLITETRESAVRFFSGQRFITLVDEEITFGQLTESSQNILKRKTVLFQGIEVELGELAEDSVIAEVIRNESLENLIQDKSVSIGPNLPDLGVEYYIPRIIARSDIEESETDDSNPNDTLDDDSNEKMCFSEHQFLEDLSEILDERRVFVLSSTPGMGKTTLWKKLAWLAKSHFRTKWIFFLKLQDSPLNSVTSGKINAADFLGKHFELPQLDRSLLGDCLTKQDSVFIFVDGFDELPASSQSPAIKLIRHLQQTVQIFVNTRTRLQLDLEEAFDVKAFLLNPISKSEQTDLFRNICGFIDGTRVDTQPLFKFVDRLMDKIHSKTMQIASNIVGVPLMVNMLAEVYKPDVLRYGQTKDPEILNKIELDALDIMQLFEQFVYSSFRRQNIDKQNLAADNRHTNLMLDRNNYLYAGFVKLHNFLGLMSLVTDKKMRLVIRDKQQLQVLRKQVSLLDSPIVSKVPNFIHGSIAEFFAAKCLFKYLSKMSDDRIETTFIKYVDKRVVYKKIYIKDTFDLYHRVLSNFPTVRKCFFLTARQHNFKLERLEMLLRCMRPYPLLWACEENFEELAVHLIKKDPNVVNVTTKKYKETALHFAAAQGHVKLCTLLIENKLDVNVQNVHNQTALHKAAYNGYDEVVKLLLERQANASALDNLQQTPLFSAALAGHSSIVQLLIGKHPNLNSLNKRGWGAVHIAAINNHTDVVRILLSRKVKIKSGKAKRWTGFLGMLLNRGHREMVELLVTYEVRSNAGTNETLFWAIRRNHIEVVRTLHRAGASINETDDRSGLSTYQLALKEGSFKIAEYILATHNSSEMPEDALHMAAEVGSVTCVSILLNSKAEVNAKNHKGESPLGLALKNSHVGVVQLLLEKSARITENMLVYAIGVNKPGSIDCAKELLLHGANPSAVYEPTGQSALHLAVLVNHYECTKLLLQRGASCHHIDKRGRTPLHYMAQGRCTYALRAFMEETVGFRNIRNMKQLIHMKDQYLGETVLSSAQSYYPELYNILKHFDVN